jgi:AcrR family transcriptional regulator
MNTPSKPLGYNGIGRVPRAHRERQILAAAVEQFELNGYDAASVGAIGAQVGVTKTLVHHYFGCKRDVHRACLAWASNELLADIEADPGRSSPGAEPEVALRSLFTAIEDRRAMWLLLSDALHRGQGELIPAVDRCRDAVDRIASACTAGLLHAAADEDSAESAALQQGWWGLVTGLVRWWTRHPEQSAHAMADRCARLLAIPTPVSR